MPNAHFSVVCVTSIFNGGLWLEVFTMSKNEFRTRHVDRTGTTNSLFMQSPWRHMIESASKLRTITSRAHCCVDSDNVTSQSWRHCLFSQLVVTSGLSGAPWTPHSWTISVCNVCVVCTPHRCLVAVGPKLWLESRYPKVSCLSPHQLCLGLKPIEMNKLLVGSGWEILK